MESDKERMKRFDATNESLRQTLSRLHQANEKLAATNDDLAAAVLRMEARQQET